MTEMPKNSIIVPGGSFRTGSTRLEESSFDVHVSGHVPRGGRENRYE